MKQEEILAQPDDIKAPFPAPMDPCKGCQRGALRCVRYVSVLPGHPSLSLPLNCLPPWQATGPPLAKKSKEIQSQLHLFLLLLIKDMGT